MTMSRQLQPCHWRLEKSREQMSELEAWDSFYVIIASAAGALIGL
jgi:hypothetical protein